jgi:putative oxidoreductase
MLGIPQTLELEVRLVLLGVGILLLVGLWTPVVGTASGIIELLIAFSQAGNYVPHILLAILSISLALLGPGAWSIDARVFGRKRIEIKSGNS